MTAPEDPNQPPGGPAQTSPGPQPASATPEPPKTGENAPGAVSRPWDETRATLGQLFGTAKPAESVPAELQDSAGASTGVHTEASDEAQTEASAAPFTAPTEAAAFDLRDPDAPAGSQAEGAVPSPAPTPPTPPAEVGTLGQAVVLDSNERADAALAESAALPEGSAVAALDPGAAVAEAAPAVTPAPVTPSAEEVPEGPTPGSSAQAIPTASPAEPPSASLPAPGPAPVPVQAPASSAPPVPSPSGASGSAGFSDDVEEQILAPSAPAQGPQAGQVVDGFHLNEDLGRGWFTANEVSSGPSLDVYVRPDPLWAALLPHRALPSRRQVGSVHVLGSVQGERLTPPLSAPLALKHLGDLARLLFALEKQGYAVTDLDPQAIRVSPDGLKLRFPPRVARLGEVAEPTLREGFTPPEVQAGQSVRAETGVYVLGALLYHWLTGQTLPPLPPEGPTPSVLGGVQAPGLPQLLYQTLGPTDQRLSPQELLAVLKAKTSAPMPAYQVAAATTVGLNPDRPTNEDSYGFTWHQVDADGFPEHRLRATVSDGMGGMAAGEVASRAAVRAFLTSAKESLVDMVWEANAAVLEAMGGRDGGCTLSGVEVRGEQVQLGHVGDTRAYLRQGGEVRQLTKDHSYVAAMVASGQLTPEEAQHSPDRNKVLRSLGSVRVPQANYVQTLEEPLTLDVGDRVLLLSDGVWGEVEPQTLRDLLLNEPGLQTLVDRLIELSLQAGAPDNATALVIERTK